MTLSHRTVFTEAPNPHISFCWGRMQPPHRGHMGVINTVKATAKAGAWAIFVTKTHDNKKNPLTYDQKVKWLYALYPETKNHLVVDPNIRTIMQAAVHLYDKGFRSATFVAGEDDMPQLRKLLEDYNGKQMDQGYYNFEPFSFMESPRILNATNARQAAKDGDPDAFERATQVPQNLTVDGKTLFQTVRLGLGLSEEPPQVQEGKSVPDVNYGIGSKPGQTFTIGDIYGKKNTKVPHAYLHSGKNKKRNKKLGIPEAASLSVEQLAHISDAALDDAYHYGLSTPGANFGWLANIESAAAAKRMIDSGIKDVDAIASAIHDGWNKTAVADYMGKLQLDTPTIGDKKKKRYALAQQTYAQLPEVEKEKDRVVARAMLQALGIVSEAPGIGGDWGDNPKLVKRGRKPYEPNVDDTYYGSTHGVDLDLYGLPKYELDEDLTPEQWAELRVSDPRAYRGDKDYTNRRWWTLQFKKARATARERGAQRFEFPPGSKNSYMVAPDLANEELEEYTVFDIHREFFEEISKLDRKLFENSGEYESLQNLLTDYDSAKPVIGKKYIYVSISSTPVAKIMNIAKFNNAHTLIGIENNRYIFNINGSRKLYPETGSMQGDALQKVFLLDSTEYLGQMLTQLSLRFSDWKITFKELPENKINEAASEKSTKAEAKYQAMPRNGQRCDHCTMWRPPHGCSAVAGKIAPNGWCSYYKRSHRSDVDESENLDEAASSVLFHYTGSVGAALNILKNNEFKLSISTGTVEAQYAPKGYNYFMSATRSKVGGYHEIVGDTGVMFNLDGNWFNSRYPVKAIDYWAGMHRGDRHNESEDRIFAREPSIPADAITAIHILLKEKGEYGSPTTRQLMITSKKRGLPTYLYSDESAWRLQDTRRALPVSAARDILSGIKRTNFYVSSSNFGKRMLVPWLELIFKKKRSELSKKANDLRYSLTYWNGGQFSDDLGLRNEISNARKPGNSGYEEANKIIAAMRKIGANDVRDLLMFLHKKWDAEAQQPAKSDNAAQSAIAKIRASAAKKESVEEALDPNETHGWILPNGKVVYFAKEYHLNYLKSQGIETYEEAFAKGYVRFVNGNSTFFVEGNMPSLKKFYRVYAQTALSKPNITIDIVTNPPTDLYYNYTMPLDKAKFIKKFGPPQNEHAGSILGTVGGGNDYPDRQVATFPWDRWVQPDTGGGEVSYIRKSRKFKKK